MNTKAYLNRIGLNENDIELSYEFLSLLQYAHVTSVPYENLDIIDGIPLSLEVDDIFDKVVTSGRGGYCFELNSLFSALLCELGFHTRSFFARFLRGESTLPIRRHRLIGAECEGKLYICDVGMGQGAPRHPLLLCEGVVQEQFGESYKFERDDLHGWILYDLHEGEWRKFCSFTEELQTDADFVPTSFYCEKHPASPFNKTAMVAIKTPDGRKAINDRDFKIFCGNQLVYIEEGITDERFCEILKSEFGIDRRK